MGKVVALSGGIGSGKSTVRAMLEKLGATTICADAIVHALQAPGTEILGAIVEAFGAGVIDSAGHLDRAALGEIVFRDPEARARLGGIMHPPVIAEMLRQSELGIQQGAPLVVLDIPLYFEGQRSGTGSAVARDYDASILVWVPAEVQILRTVERDACAQAEAQRRVDAQMPIDEKKEYATHVVDNSGGLPETQKQVDALYRSLTQGS
ncbi:MAG: dephospho-CoA kinase [Myxococcota bacterium]|jgi:dephospho-CoA kinase|nr:dephospho-CoA kinase [Myxococcota bacterium]